LSSTTSEQFPTNIYLFQEKSTLKIGDQEYETSISYNLFVENEQEEEDFEVSIERTNFKVNEKKIDTKFLTIANQYMEALFPLHCVVENFRLKIVNLAEIQRRIKKKDDQLEAKYGGDGLINIQNQFKKATDTVEKISDFVKQLPFMKILNFGMQKFEKNQNYFIKWNILAIGYSKWKGEMIYSKDVNKLIYEPKIDNAQEMMNEIIQYIHKNDHDVDFEEENIGLFADFKLNIDYTGETGRMKKADTEICIEVENKFFYEQKITLSNK